MKNRRAFVCVVGTLLSTALLSTCNAAAAVGNPEDRWRPCRATASRRRNDDIVQIPVPAAQHDDDANEDDDFSAAGDDLTDNGDEYVPSFTVDEKPRRGARAQNNGKLHEKKFDRPPPQTGNGLRTDKSQFSSESVQIPSYANIPVTLRCKFLPLEGTDNKFETVVEGVYPGHIDVADSLPLDWHGSQVLKQMISSVDGWRNVINKSTRPVRRVLEYRFGQNARPVDAPADPNVLWHHNDNGRRPNSGRRYYNDNDDGRWHGRVANSRSRYDGETVDRQIVARQRAIERMERARRARLNQMWAVQDGPEEERPQYLVNDEQVELQQYDIPPAEEQMSENQLFEDQQLTEQVDDSPSNEQVDESLLQNEEVNNQEQAEKMDDLDQGEQQTHDRQPELVDYQPTDDQFVVDSVDRSRWTQRQRGEESVNEVHSMTSKMPQITTTAKSDYATFSKGIPVKTFTEHAITTPLT